MVDFIRELYYDNLKPQNEFEISDRLAELYARQDALEGRLSEALENSEAPEGGALKSLFLDYVDACNEASALNSEERFVTGFRFGARFSADVFGGDETYLRESPGSVDSF